MTMGRSWFEGWPPAAGSVQASRDQLLRFIDETLEKYPTPDGKVVLCGFSQGGVMAFDPGFRTRRAVAAIVSMSGAIFENEVPDPAAWPNVRVLIVHGTSDDTIPVVVARRARRFLESNGVPPEYHEFAIG